MPDIEKHKMLKTKSSCCSFINISVPNPKKTIPLHPAANPSSPSVKFTELLIPTSIKKETGNMKIFMGDTGSLSIGAILGSIALLTNSVFTLSIFSGIFIIESISVMIQVGFFKITKKLFHRGKRIFLMAPLHHHFELKGIKEQKIVENFWKINILLVILGIVLKINL